MSFLFKSGWQVQFLEECGEIAEKSSEQKTAPAKSWAGSTYPFGRNDIPIDTDGLN
jgi:hypothetical protein